MLMAGESCPPSCVPRQDTPRTSSDRRARASCLTFARALAIVICVHSFAQRGSEGPLGHFYGSRDERLTSVGCARHSSASVHPRRLEKAHAHPEQDILPRPPSPRASTSPATSPAVDWAASRRPAKHRGGSPRPRRIGLDDAIWIAVRLGQVSPDKGPRPSLAATLSAARLPAACFA